MRRDLGLAQAANTKQKYKRYWEQFKSFMTDKLQARYKPASQQHLAWYVTYLHNNLHLKASSIRPHLSAIAYYHQLAGLNSPTDSFLVARLLAGYKKHDPATRVRKPITYKIVTALYQSLATVPLTHYERDLYQALFLIMYHALLRSSEVCEAKNTNHTLQHNQITVRKSRKGATLKITLGSYKHSTAQPVPLIVSPTQDGYCPVKAFQRYQKRRGGSKGPIFRHQDGSPISRSRLASVLKYHLKLTGRNASHYNTHSFRQGRATDMSKKGYTETQIASAGRWKSKVPRVYVKPDTVHCGSL